VDVPPSGNPGAAPVEVLSGVAMEPGRSACTPGTINARQIAPGADLDRGGAGISGGGTSTWQLYTNEVQKDIREHPAALGLPTVKTLIGVQTLATCLRR